MQKVVLVLFTLMFMVAVDSEAQSRRRTSDPYASSSSSMSFGPEGRSAISGALGFFGPGQGVYAGKANNTDTTVSPTLSGLFGIGGEFEHFMRDDFSVGGIFRYYSTSDSQPTGTGTSVEVTNTLLTLGGIARAHVFNTNSWTGFFTTGLGILNASGKSGNTSVEVPMGFGLYLGMGILYKMNSDLAIGIENLRAMGLGEKHNGWVLDDYMAKVRFFM